MSVPAPPESALTGMRAPVVVKASRVVVVTADAGSAAKDGRSGVKQTRELSAALIPF